MVGGILNTDTNTGQHTIIRLNVANSVVTNDMIRTTVYVIGSYDGVLDNNFPSDDVPFNCILATVAVILPDVLPAGKPLPLLYIGISTGIRVRHNTMQKKYMVISSDLMICSS